MINETQQPNVTEHIPPQVTFGIRLKAAREAQGLERRDVAAQLRLNEKIITMMEKDRYPADLPVTFIRGYLRAYSKLLQIPEHEVRQAIEPIKPKPLIQDANLVIKHKTTEPVVTSSNYFMQLFTLLIVLTLAGLVAIWWHSHSNAPTTTVIESQLPDTIQQNTSDTAGAIRPPMALPPEAPTPAAATPSTAPALATQAPSPTVATKPTTTAPAPVVTQTDVESKLNNRNDAAEASESDDAEVAPTAKRHVAPVVDADDPEPDNADVNQTD